MVASDHPLASEMGAKVLEEGGNAVDAGVATLLTLGLVNPFASGLGGGGFCVYKPAGQEASVLDFRETAPAAATRDMYVRDGKVVPGLSTQGGLAVATPGEAAGLHMLHERFGRRPWAQVVEPVAAVASKGFSVGVLLPKRLAQKDEALGKFPALKAFYQRGGAYVKTGDVLKSPKLAEFLRRYAKEGPSAFYQGKYAEAIVAAVQAHGGILTVEDVAGFKPTWRKPLVGSYRGYDLWTVPPPSSGGTTLLQALNIMERYDLGRFGLGVESQTIMIEALKHAFADRATWLGDDEFVDVPVERLVSKAYAAELQRRIRPWTVGSMESYGTSAPPPNDDGTSHVSIMDREGNMLACTSTVNTIFGSMVFVPEMGIVLNNEMDDFSPQPGVANAFGLVGTEQNAVAGGKRPLSSMAPTVIERDGEPFMAVGASGGPTIISGTLHAIVHVIDHGLGVQEAVDRPRLHAQWVPDFVFMEAVDPVSSEILSKRGHVLKVRPGFTAVQVVVRRDGVYEGASDPRKNGEPAAPQR